MADEQKTTVENSEGKSGCTSVTGSAKITNAATQNHRNMMTLLAYFCQVDEVQYEDLGKGEDYILIRGTESLKLKVRTNAVDGGFLTVALLPNSPDEQRGANEKLRVSASGGEKEKI